MTNKQTKKCLKGYRIPVPTLSGTVTPCSSSSCSFGPQVEMELTKNLGKFLTVFSVSEFPVRGKTVKQRVIRAESSCWGLDEDKLSTDRKRWKSLHDRGQANSKRQHSFDCAHGLLKNQWRGKARAPWSHLSSPAFSQLYRGSLRKPVNHD